MERNNKLAVKMLRDKQSELSNLKHSYNKILQENELLKNENLKLKQDNKSIQQEFNFFNKIISRLRNTIKYQEEELNSFQSMFLNSRFNKHELMSDILARENSCILEVNNYKAIIKEKDRCITKLQSLESEINILYDKSNVEDEIYLNRHNRIIEILIELTSNQLIKWKSLDPIERIYKIILANTQRGDYYFDDYIEIYVSTVEACHFVFHWNQDTDLLYCFYGLHKHRWSYVLLEVPQKSLEDLLNAISYSGDNWTPPEKFTKLIMNSYKDYKISEEW